MKLLLRGNISCVVCSDHYLSDRSHKYVNAYDTCSYIFMHPWKFRYFCAGTMLFLLYYRTMTSIFFCARCIVIIISKLICAFYCILIDTYLPSTKVIVIIILPRTKKHRSNGLYSIATNSTKSWLLGLMKAKLLRSFVYILKYGIINNKILASKFL